MMICPLKEVILSLILFCNPKPVAMETNIIIVLIATAMTAIFIIGAETLFLYSLEVTNRFDIKYSNFNSYDK